MSDELKVGDNVKLNEKSILGYKGDKLVIIEITENQYVLSNGWKVQKDWVNKI